MSFPGKTRRVIFGSAKASTPDLSIIRKRGKIDDFENSKSSNWPLSKIFAAKSVGNGVFLLNNVFP